MRSAVYRVVSVLSCFLLSLGSEWRNYEQFLSLLIYVVKMGNFEPPDFGRVQRGCISIRYGYVYCMTAYATNMAAAV